MTESNLKETIELKFYKDDELDLTLLDLLNRDTFKRGREYFIKDLLKKHFIEIDQENFTNIKKKHKDGAIKIRKMNEFFKKSL